MTKNENGGNAPHNKTTTEGSGQVITWFTSDTHFGHANIIRYCDRPFKDVAHMNEAIVENWNQVVGEDDLVFHLGDVALGPWEQWDAVLSRLNGYKILVVGNHEKIFPGENNQKRIDRFPPEYEKWFDEIFPHFPGHTLSNGQVINLSHFPYEDDHMEKARFMDYRLPDDGTPLVHGHTHLDKVMSRSKNGAIQVHVGMDAHHYTPVSEQQVIDYIRVADDVV